MLLGKVDGFCKGKGGSMHIADIALGNLGANGIVGAGIPIATGAAVGLGFPAAPIMSWSVSSGRERPWRGSSTNRLNFAGRQKLPIVYVIKNDRYCLSTPIGAVAAVDDLSQRAAGYGYPGQGRWMEWTSRRSRPRPGGQWITRGREKVPCSWRA